MSNPNRSLNHRTLPPFNGANKNFKIMEREKYVGSKVQREFQVTEYLLMNPDFVTEFLINHYQCNTLAEIIHKIDPKFFEVIKEGNHPKFLDKVNNVVKVKKDSVRRQRAFSVDVSNKMFSQSKVDLDTENLISLNDTTWSVSNHMSISKLRRMSTRMIRFTPYLEEKFNKNSILSQFDIRKFIFESMMTDLSSVLAIDNSNIYIADSSQENLHLISSNAVSYNIENDLHLCTYVARNRIGVNCPDVFMDDTFSTDSNFTNPFTQSVMAQPIILYNNDLAGVVELHRNSLSSSFNNSEEEIFINYCYWVALSIYYNEIYISHKKQERLNKFIIEVTQKMFEKIKNMDLIIKEIMESAKNLVKADRVTLFLLDKKSKLLYSRIVDVGSYEQCIFETTEQLIKFPMGEGIAGQVAYTGETLNIKDAYSDKRFNRNVDLTTGYVTRTILAMPVKMGKEIIGVVQMLNKGNGFFTSDDENDFQTFAIYCGLALHIGKMYEKLLRSQQKYKVALDVLSYHSGYREVDFEMIRNQHIPHYIDSINSLEFWPWKVSSTDRSMYFIYMFKDLFGLEVDSDISESITTDTSLLKHSETTESLPIDSPLNKFDKETLTRFVLTVKQNYRNVPYHNWGHAFSVAHTMYAMLKTCDHGYCTNEMLAMFIGCLCHDLDHRGKTNQFMVQSESALSALYSTSTMEHHHFNMTVSILQRSGHNILENLSSHNYRTVLANIKHCILATDLVKYFEVKDNMLKSNDPLNFKAATVNMKLNYMAVSMTLCDLCSMFKVWEMQLAMVMTIMEEFWCQGDEEKKRGKIPHGMMDRENKIELPQQQVGFLKSVCLPCYQLLQKLMPELDIVVNSADHNLRRWVELAALPSEECGPAITELQNFVSEFIRTNQLHLT